MRTSGLSDCALLLVVLSAAALVHAQFEDDFGPSSQRLIIPGAVPLGPAPRRLQGRPRTLQAAPGPESGPRPRARPPSGRRLPGPVPPPPQPSPVPVSPFFSPSPALLQQQRPLIQQQQQRSLIHQQQQQHHQQGEPFIPPRPVIEDAEDDFDNDFTSPSQQSFSPTPSPSTPPPPPPPPPPQRTVPFRPERPPFRPEPRPVLLPTPVPELNYVSPTRQQLRPTVFKNTDEEEDDEEEDDEPRRKPTYNRGENLRNNKARPTTAPEETQQYSRQSQAQYNRAQQNAVRAPQKQSYSSGKQQDYEKPIRQHQRPKKPVAQVLRRYREDNEDGSITWGFENDDGSFKEETIGTDCVTYGKYGYIDPDGTRREYSYSTGVPCDRNKNDSEEQPSEGYVDYAENKYVLPNGDSVDLDKMVKNRARRPVSGKQYRTNN